VTKNATEAQRGAAASALTQESGEVMLG